MATTATAWTSAWTNLNATFSAASTALVEFGYAFIADPAVEQRLRELDELEEEMYGDV